MAKEPTKRELLERIEKLERQANDLRLGRIIDNKDGPALTEYLMEGLEIGQRKRQTGKV